MHISLSYHLSMFMFGERLGLYYTALILIIYFQVNPLNLGEWHPLIHDVK